MTRENENALIDRVLEIIDAEIKEYYLYRDCAEYTLSAIRRKVLALKGGEQE